MRAGRWSARGAELLRRPELSRTGALYALTRAFAVGIAVAGIVPRHAAAELNRYQAADVTGVYYVAHQKLLLGQLPYRDFAFEYPPLSALVLVLPGPLGKVPFFLSFVALMLACDLAVFVALRRLESRSWSRAGLGWASWIWLASAPALWGLTLQRNDLLACAAVATAVVAAAGGRGGRAGALLAVAVLVKGWPLVVLACLMGWRDRTRRAILLSSATCLGAAALVLHALGMLGPCLRGLASYHGERGLEVEALAARPVLVRHAVRGTDPPITWDYGSVNLAGAESLVLTTTVLTAAGLGLVALAAARRWRRRLDLQRDLLVALVLVAALLGAAKVFSAQYVLWLLVVAALALAVAPGRTGLGRATLAFLGASAVAYPEFFWRMFTAQWSGLVAYSVRDACLGAVLVSAGLLLRRRGGASTSEAGSAAGPTTAAERDAAARADLLPRRAR